MPAPDNADREDLILIEQTVREAGAIARAHFGGHYKRWNKGGSPVTEVDIAIDTFLRDALRTARPRYGWLSEETADNPQRLATERTFIVDPIDGTTAFIKGRPHFTVCCAVVSGGRPRAGAVYNPITEESFAAALGWGATRNSTPVHVTGCSAIEGCRMIAPRTTFEHPVWSRAPNTPWPSMDIQPRSSVAYRLALVAAGEADAALALSPKHDWDTAAGDIIVHEAGGLLTDHTGRVLRYNGPAPIQRSLVAAGPALHALLLARLKTAQLP